MTALLQTTFDDLTRPLLSSTRPGHAEIMQTSWRYSLREVDEHLSFIPEHLRVIAERNDRLSTGDRVHRPVFIKHTRELLAIRLPRYLAAVRRVSEAEADMDRLGIRYARSSDAWDEADGRSKREAA